MNDPYNHRKLDAIGETLSVMSGLIEMHLPQLGDSVRSLVESLEGRFDDIDRERQRDILQGKGPMTLLRQELGLAIAEPMDLFAQVQGGDQLSHHSLNEMLKEIFPRHWTGLSEGGDFQPVWDDLPSFHDNYMALTSGFYRLDGRWVMLVITLTDAHVRQHCLYPLRVDQTGHEKTQYHPRIATFVKSENTWVEHQFYQTVPVRKLRDQLHSLLAQHGYNPPQAISLEEFQATIAERVRLERDANVAVVGQGVVERQFKIAIDDYRVEILWSAKLNVGHVNVVKGHYPGTRLRWDELSPAKQRQLYNIFSVTEAPSIDSLG